MTKSLTSIARKPVNRRTLLKGTAAAGAMGLSVKMPGAVRAQDTLQIAFSVPGLNFPFFVHMMQLAEEHAESLGVEFIPLDGQQQGAPSSAKQTADLEAMIVQGISGVVISPNDVAALAPAIEAVMEAGIPVVTVDRNVTDVETTRISIAPRACPPGNCSIVAAMRPSLIAMSASGNASKPMTGMSSPFASATSAAPKAMSSFAHTIASGSGLAASEDSTTFTASARAKFAV